MMKLQYYFDKVYWKVRSWIKPQHTSLRKTIPRKWMDLDSIVEDFLDAVIISFVEEEEGLNQIELMEKSLNLTDEQYENQWGSKEEFQHYYNARYSDYLTLKEIYNWVKTGRYKMKEVMDSYLMGKHQDYGKYNDLEAELNKKNTEYYLKLVKLRGYLWT